MSNSLKIFFFLCIYIILPKNIFSENDKNKINNLALGIISSWNIKCGIAMYTNNIVKALNEKNIFPVVYSNRFNVTKIIEQITKDNINVINVQYRYGLYTDNSELLTLFKELKKNKIKTVLTIHLYDNFIDELLPFVDCIILHKRIPGKKIGTSNQVHFIPMGTPVYDPPASKITIRSKYGFSDKDKILVTNGFMFTCKQHANILRELVPYLKKSKQYKVQLLTAYNDIAWSQCNFEKNNIQKVIAEYNIQDQVVHITDFISQEELSERIWLSDLGYLWIDNNTNETSAAAKEFIAGRIPLVITNSNHFHDIAKGVVRVEFNKKIFARKIFNTLDSFELVNLQQQMVQLYEEKNYRNLIGKFITAYFD